MPQITLKKNFKIFWIENNELPTSEVILNSWQQPILSTKLWPKKCILYKLNSKHVKLNNKKFQQMKLLNFWQEPILCTKLWTKQAVALNLNLLIEKQHLDITWKKKVFIILEFCVTFYFLHNVCGLHVPYFLAVDSWMTWFISI